MTNLQPLVLRSQKIMILIGIFATLSSLSLGFQNVCISQLQYLFKHQNNFNKSQLVYYISFATSGLNFGAILGILMYTNVTKYLRTSQTLLFTDIISTISVLVMLYSLDPIRIGIARFFFGIASGLSASVLPIYLNSISPIQIRGKIGTINQIMIGLGMIFAYLINFILIQDQRDQIRWRILLGFPLIPTILRILFFKYYFNFETIESHLERKQDKKLEEYLKLIYKNGTIQHLREQKLLDKDEDCVISSDQQNNQRHKKCRKRLLVALVVIASNQISGINAIFFYSKQLFGNIINLNELSPIDYTGYLMIICSIIQLVSNLISTNIIQKYGRKLIILGGQIILVGILFTIFLCEYVKNNISYSHNYDYIVILLIFVHIAVFNLSLGPMCIVYSSQISSEIHLIIITLKLCSLFFAVTSNFMITYLGIGNMFLILAIGLLTSFLYLDKKMIETKQKSIREIHMLFDKKNT